MTVKGKKVTELAAWSGDQDMLIHAAKPGVSEAVSIADIVAAGAGAGGGPGDGGGGGYELGDIVLRPVGDYPGFVSVDGSEQLDPAEYPGLADLVGVGTGFRSDGAVIEFQGLTYLNHFVVFEGVTYATDGLEALVIANDAGSNIINSDPMTTFGSRLFKTENGVYCFVIGPEDANLCRVAPDGTLTQTGYTRISYDISNALNDGGIFIVSLGDNEFIAYPDISDYCLITSAGVIDLSTIGSDIGDRYSYIRPVVSANGRIFAQASDNYSYEAAIIELVVDGTDLSAIHFAELEPQGQLAVNESVIFELSMWVRVDYYGNIPDEFRIHMLDGSQGYSRSQFLDETADNESLRLTESVAIFTTKVLAGEGVLHVVDLNSGVVSSRYAPNLYIIDTDNGDIYNGWHSPDGTTIEKYTAIDVARLPVIEPPAPGVKYYIKIN